MLQMSMLTIFDLLIDGLAHLYTHSSISISLEESREE